MLSWVLLKLFIVDWIRKIRLMGNTMGNNLLEYVWFWYEPVVSVIVINVSSLFVGIVS